MSQFSLWLCYCVYVFVGQTIRINAIREDQTVCVYAQSAITNIQCTCVYHFLFVCLLFPRGSVCLILNDSIIEFDPYICKKSDSQELSNEYESEIACFEKYSSCISLNRSNRDKHINNYGYRLLDFCKCNSLYILNGRTGRDKGIGKCTSKEVSTIDYFLSRLV